MLEYVLAFLNFIVKFKIYVNTFTLLLHTFTHVVIKVEIYATIIWTGCYISVKAKIFLSCKSLIKTTLCLIMRWIFFVSLKMKMIFFLILIPYFFSWEFTWESKSKKVGVYNLASKVICLARLLHILPGETCTISRDALKSIQA